MSYKQTGFKRLLTDLASKQNARMSDLADQDPELLVNSLNQGLKWCWRDYAECFAHPATVGHDLLTITDGVLTREQVELSDWVSVWDKDPRANRSARRLIPSSDDDDGWHLGTAVEEAFVFWRKPVPEFTHEIVVSADSYATGALVWDKDGSKEVFKALDDNVLGSELSDAAKWEKVTVPDLFADAAVNFARGDRLTSNNLPAGANYFFKIAEGQLESEYARVLNRSNGHAPAWLMLSTNL